MGRKSEARQQILSAAIELIHARGYNGVGIQEICEKAGVNKGSFYYFFGAKRELLLAIIDHLTAYLDESFFAPIHAANLPPREAILAIFRQHGVNCANSKRRAGVLRGCPIGNLVMEMAAQEEGAAARLHQAMELFAVNLNIPVRRAMDRGEIPPGDSLHIARTLTAYLQGITLLAKAGNDPEAIERYAEGALRLAGFDAPAKEDAAM
jgi:TetR/AcrR family transcriptional repressor of nem operon